MKNNIISIIAASLSFVCIMIFAFYMQEKTKDDEICQRNIEFWEQKVKDFPGNAYMQLRLKQMEDMCND